MMLLVVGDYRVVSKDVGSKKDGRGTTSEPNIGYVTVFPRALQGVITYQY
jgi:hypothetical protein